MKVFLLAVLATLCVADVYMHMPRGSNNRLNEANAQRNNGNRLFDSQNNNRGGYNVGDRTDTAHDTTDPYDQNPDNVLNPDVTDNKQYQMAYFEGSELTVEWTNQHACGGNEADDPQKVNCQLVIQYMCSIEAQVPGTTTKDYGMSVYLRNGGSTNRPTEPNNFAEVMTDADSVATTPPTDDQGRHESKGWYYECKNRERNKGLLTLDQKLQGSSAKYTRQNPNGNQNGLECPEERDYYPYWWPAPWVDVAYLTDRVERCPDIAAATQNTNAVYKCRGLAGTSDSTTQAPIQQEACETAGGTWTAYEKNRAGPDCEQAPWSRTNHLGNGRDGQHINYTWTLPAFDDLIGDAFGDTHESKKCVLRLRYNISTDDYDPWNSNSSHNYAVGVEQNPTVDIGTTSRQGLQLAINTNQFGRTFQDRSHTFFVMKRPSGAPSGKIYNLNVRGKRGNIVQTYPSVEYDFVPNRMTIGTDDLYHVQWTGSNTHNNGGNGGDGQTGDDGQGTGGTDRNNFVSIKSADLNYPIPLDKAEFDDLNIVKQSTCYTLQNFVGTSTASTYEDCAVTLATSGYYRDVTTASTQAALDTQLNTAPASLIGGVVMKTNTRGRYHYMSSRNNNFSNRGQKAWIVVE